MEETIRQTEEIIYPSIVFRIQDNYYCVNSRYVSTIMQLPHHEPLPNAPHYMTGIFPHRGGIVQMLDLRSVFGVQTQAQEFVTFSQMLEDRKQDHIRWVNALEHSARTREPFTLATDPHKCAFGKWYDNYKCEHEAVCFHLRKIDEPHRLLHEVAHDVIKCSQDCENCTRPTCLKVLLEQAREMYMPKVLGLLEEAKEIFHDEVYHEMVLILSGDEPIGLVVDEVVSVEDLGSINSEHIFNDGFNSSEYLLSIRKSVETDRAILEIDVEKLLALFRSAA